VSPQWTYADASICVQCPHRLIVTSLLQLSGHITLGLHSYYASMHANTRW